MPLFEETLETIRAEEADVRRLFDGDGQRVRSNHRDQRYMANLAEAANFLADVIEGRRPMRHLEEAMTTSDFPLLMGDVLDRQLLGAYRELPPVYQAYARVGLVRDFRDAKRFAIDGGEGQLELVPEKAPYPAAALVESKDSISVDKYGRRFHLTWEDFVNDDLGGLDGLSGRLARGARRSEQKTVTQLIADANGPHASIYTTGHKNKVTSNAALSVTAMQEAFTVLGAIRDADNEPIAIDAVTLVIPPALEVVANNIINGTELLVAAGSSSATADQIRTANWLKNRVTVVVDPYLPIVITNGTRGNTSWFLFANPNSTDRVAAVEIAFLRGHRDPALFMKRPDAQRIGGTAGPDGDMADFDTDSVQYKVRHVYGGAQLLSTGGWRGTVASNGTGS